MNKEIIQALTETFGLCKIAEEKVTQAEQESLKANDAYRKQFKLNAKHIAELIKNSCRSIDCWGRFACSNIGTVMNEHSKEDFKFIGLDKYTSFESPVYLEYIAHAILGCICSKEFAEKNRFSLGSEHVAFGTTSDEFMAHLRSISYDLGLIAEFSQKVGTVDMKDYIFVYVSFKQIQDQELKGDC